MHTPGGGGASRHSAFAAAFFSSLFPGLGHAYLHRWGRALAWAAIPLLLVALIAGFLVNSETRSDFVAQFASPSWLVGTLVFIALDFVYRVASAIDAYRIARSATPSASPPFLRAASLAGLAATVLVLGLAHVAVARPVYLTYDLLICLDGHCTPDEEEPTPDPSASQDPGIITPPPLPTAEPGASASPVESQAPEPTRRPEWDGTERLNILLIGADKGAERTTYLTDTMIVASIDPVTKRLAFISLPRDTSGVPLPPEWPAARAYGGAYPNKINTLYSIAKGSSLFPGVGNARGYGALKGALSELYDLDVKYYIAVDLDGFKKVIDSLGGIIVDVQVPVADDHYPSEDGRGSLNLYIPAGIRHMDGAEALAYARARHQTSDFDRAARQQNVIVALRQQTDLPSLLAPGVLEQLFSAFKETVRTDIPPELFPRLVSLAEDIDVERRVSLILTPPAFVTECYPCPPDGLYELQANVPAIQRAVRDIFETTPEEEERRQKIAGEAAVVHVLNGSTDPRQATSVADHLASIGVDAVVPPINGGRADTSDHTETVITVYNGVEVDMPETIALLEETFGVTVVTATDEAQAADIVVITGSETPPLAPAE